MKIISISVSQQKMDKLDCIYAPIYQMGLFNEDNYHFSLNNSWTDHMAFIHLYITLALFYFLNCIQMEYTYKSHKIFPRLMLLLLDILPQGSGKFLSILSDPWRIAGQCWLLTHKIFFFFYVNFIWILFIQLNIPLDSLGNP